MKPWSPQGNLIFPPPRRNALGFKCHLSEAVSTANNVKDVAHLQREVHFVLQALRACVRRSRDESMFELH